jgi:MFS family permease
LIWLAIVLANSVGVYSMFSPQAAYFAELFDTRVRYSGLALAREVSAPFAGGIAPFVATYLLSRTGTYWPIALYMIVLALISLVAWPLGPRRTGGGYPRTKSCTSRSCRNRRARLEGDASFEIGAA